MGLYVDFETAGARVSLGAVRTLKGQLSSVNEFMSLQVPLRDEHFAAAFLLANKRSFASLRTENLSFIYARSYMNSEVGLQIPCFDEQAIAVNVRAFHGG